jgi:hypothetical protein
LTETDALVREDLLKMMLSQRIYISFLVREVYESLIGLQVFSTDLNDVAIQLMMKTILQLFFDTMEITEEEDFKELRH